MQLADVLKHIRTNRRFDLASVAHATGISESRLQEFEQGKREPTSRQFEALAETYGVPSYLMGIEALPNLQESPKDFRRSVPSPAHLSPPAMQRIWAAEQVAEATKQLLEATKAPLASWSKDVPSGKLSVATATKLRSYFDEWLSPRQQRLGFTGTDEQKFFGALRIFIEAQGTVVRVNQAPPDDFLGFYLEPEDGAPTAFVNRKISSVKAQLFTLVHEYAHAMMGASGISDPFRLKNDVERSCNAFTAEFIAPSEEFAKTIESFARTTRGDVFKLVNLASKHSLLSKHAAAIRLKETDYIGQKELNQWLSLRAKLTGKEIKNEDAEEDEIGNDFGQVHAKLVGEIGYLPTYAAGIALDEKLISSVDVVTSISLSQSIQERAISLATRRFEVAIS
ncbi:helix-turn-helix domain-containing protein [Bradyrhizobium japonicum]|uniref:helix-turn-helix domain-containing protein n=1 Tax=Bradyrhizobium japonicum TaxID=375 RepID=UPI0027149528|nr:XRE family transcriptional regulator [Bradyrhizobium japonicum]WLB50774.1 XRE family transcriptional regulator [Bradyrhizobium japonicum]WLB67453.1 XRE family transcriptional regulator [Bradyrhizobium japonicum]